MTTRGRSWVVVVALSLTALLLHTLFAQSTFSFFPAPIILSIAFLWLLPYPWYALGGLCILAELYSTFPPGIMTGTVLSPVFFWHLKGKITIDVSFSFLLLILSSVFLQTAILALTDTLLSLEHVSPTRLLDALPWLYITSITFASTGLLFILCNILYEMVTPHATSSVLSSFTRYGRTYLR